MKLEVRAIAWREASQTALPAGYGIVRAGNLAALVEVASPQTNLTERAYLQRYRKALDSWWQAGQQTILPVQAGASLAGPNEVAQILQSRAVEFEADLSRLAGKLELGLRLPLANANTEQNTQATLLSNSKQTPGLAYMQKLLQRETGTKTQLAQIEEVILKLAKQAIDYKYIPPSSGANFAQADFLVESGNLVEFKQNIQDCGWPGVITGPIPPFSFV